MPPAPKIADKTLRFEFGDATYDPTVAGVGTSGTWSRVSAYKSNVWDWTNTNASWATAFGGGNTGTPGAFTDFDNNPVRVLGCGDLSGVTDMSRLFQNCSGISEVLKLDTHSVTNSFILFSYCENCTVFPTLDLSNSTDLRGLFQSCFAMVNAPMITMPTDHTYSLQNFFISCKSLEYIPLYNTAKCTNMQAFLGRGSSGYGVDKLEHVPLLDTSNVTNFNQAFVGCTAMKTVPLFDISSATNVLNMFNGCFNVESGAFALYTQMSTQANPPASHTGTFSNCGRDTVTGQAELAIIPIDWGGLLEPAISANTLRFEFSDTSYNPQTAGAGSSGTWTKRNEYGSSRNVWDWTRSGYNWSNSFYHNSGDFIDPNNEVSIIGCGDLSAVTHMSYMFNGCSSLVNIASLDTSHATNVYEMFTGVGCTQLPDLDFSSVTYADSALARCENLVTAPNITFPRGRAFTANALLSKCFSLVSVPSYDFTYCTSMDEFASQCPNLVNVPAMNTSNVTSMQEAFKNTAITSIPALNYSSVTNTYCMFKGCTSLTAITPINAPNITYAQSMFNGCTNVTSGILNMYNYLLDKVTTSQAHENVFLDCGINSPIGLAELEQIPPDWGGLLPANNTFRIKFENTEYDPTVNNLAPGGTWTKVPQYVSNVWDWTLIGTSLDRVFQNFKDPDRFEVILAGHFAGLTRISNCFQYCMGVTAVCPLDFSDPSLLSLASMSNFYDGCYNLVTIGDINAPGVERISQTFSNCHSLLHVPQIILSNNVTHVKFAFNKCYNIQENIYNTYLHFLEYNPSYTENCFTQCGQNGPAASELDIIPTTWGGNKAVLGGPSQIEDPYNE